MYVCGGGGGGGGSGSSNSTEGLLDPGYPVPDSTDSATSAVSQLLVVVV